MKISRVVFLFISVFVSSSAFAAKTKFEAFEDEYESASAPAKVSDFPTYAQAKTVMYNCWFANKATPSLVQYSLARQAQSNKVSTVAVGGNFARESLPDAILSKYVLSEKAMELTIFIPENSLLKFEGYPANIAYSYRKREGKIPFILQETDAYGIPRETLAAGYCLKSGRYPRTVITIGPGRPAPRNSIGSGPKGPFDDYNYGNRN